MKKMLILASLAALLAGCSSAGEDNADAEQDEKADTAAEEEAEEQHEEKKEEEEQKTAASKEEKVTYKVNEANWTVQSEESEGDEVLLTFDDAPDKNAVKIAEILAENKVPAIFFVNGMFLQDEEGTPAAARCDWSPSKESLWQIPPHVRLGEPSPERVSYK